MDNAEKKPWDSVDPREITKEIFDLEDDFMYHTKMIQINPNREEKLTGDAFIRTAENSNHLSIEYDGCHGKGGPIHVQVKGARYQDLPIRTQTSRAIPSLHMKQGDADINLYLTPDLCHRLIRMLNEVLQAHGANSFK